MQARVVKSQNASHAQTRWTGEALRKNWRRKPNFSTAKHAKDITDIFRPSRALRPLRFIATDHFSFGCNVTRATAGGGSLRISSFPASG